MEKACKMFLECCELCKSLENLAETPLFLSAFSPLPTAYSLLPILIGFISLPEAEKQTKYLFLNLHFASVTQTMIIRFFRLVWENLSSP